MELTPQVCEPSTKYLVRTPGGQESNGPLSQWPVAPLGELAVFITSGSRGWARHYAESGATFIRSQNIVKGQLDFSERQYVAPPEGAEGNRTRVKLGDVLITITGNSVGNVAYVDHDLGEAYISQHVGLVRLQEPSQAEYVCRYLSPGAPGNAQIVASQSGQSKPGLNLQDLRGFAIALPGSEEQRAIAGALSDIDALLSRLDRLIAKKLDLKLAAMQQLLTGQTRLPGFQGEWEVRLLGEHVRFLKNGVNSRAELAAYGSTKYLHYGDIHVAGGNTLDPSSLPCLSAEKARSLDRLADGDLVFVDASEDMSGVGKSVEIVGSSHTDLVAGLHTIAARFDSAVLADGFKAYLQFCPPFRQHLGRLAAGTKVYATNRRHIATVEMPLPSTDEQTAISTVLSEMDAELSALEARRDKTRALKQGMMQELLTGRTRLV